MLSFIVGAIVMVLLVIYLVRYGDSYGPPRHIMKLTQQEKDAIRLVEAYRKARPWRYVEGRTDPRTPEELEAIRKLHELLVASITKS